MAGDGAPLAWGAAGSAASSSVRSSEGFLECLALGTPASLRSVSLRVPLLITLGGLPRAVELDDKEGCRLAVSGSSLVDARAELLNGDKLLLSGDPLRNGRKCSCHEPHH